jgi:hypothetical protein
MTIGGLIVAAILAEAVWETGKMVWQEGKLQVDRIGALVVGLLIAIGAGLDVCALLGLTFAYPIIGQIATGILFSRGANFLHDLFKRVEGIQ